MTNPLAARVAKARAEKKLTLRALGAKVGLSYQTVARVEQGKGGLDATNKVLEALGFTAKERGRLLSAALVKALAA